jgi:N-acetyl-alpha-D-glucosaminyl L-malate synthase BshA
MRIAILVPGFPPKWLAGTEIATYNIAKYLAKRGHEVHVITSLDEGLPKENIEEGFFVHRVRTINKPVLAGLAHNLMSFLIIKKIDPDVIHCQFISSGIAGFLAKRIMEKPYVVYGRGSDVYMPWAFKNIVSKLVMRSADAMIALTEDMKSEMQKIYNREVFLIPNGVDLNMFKNLSKNDLRSKFNVKDENIVLFVGGFRFVKGVKYLIEAMNSIRQKNITTRLMLVGSEGDKEKLDGLVNDSDSKKYVILVGKVPHEKVAEYMVASDVFVLPSLSEGFPNVILEAMASGLPIVATRVGGLPHIVKHAENGFLVEPKNPEEIAEKVLLILESEALRKKMSDNNKETAKEYSWERVVAKLEEVYRSCI